MDEFISKMMEYSKKNNLFVEGEGIVVGVSGGRDSVCLLTALDLCREYIDIDIIVVHLNHCIRGEDADADEAFVKELAEKKGLPYYGKRVEVTKLAKKMHMSCEEAGRHARYAFLEEIREYNGFNHIAVAHYQNDVVETILFNMARGSGAKGVSGISPKREKIIRPLLWATDAEMNDFVRKHSLEFRTDKTNFEEEYSRNKIRKRVIPYFEREINENAVLHFFSAADKIRKEHEFVEKLAIKKYQEIVYGVKNENEYDESEFNEGKNDENSGKIAEIWFPQDAFNRIEEVLQVEILKLIFMDLVGKTKDITQKHYEILIEFIRESTTSKELNMPYRVEVKNEYGKIRMRRHSSTQTTHNLIQASEYIPLEELKTAGELKKNFVFRGKSITFSFSLIEKEKLSKEILQKDYTKCLDYDKIKSGVFIRNPRGDDYFIMDASGKKKKLSRYMIDKKIPADVRDKEVVLAEGSHVLWVLPDRISEYYKITSETKNVLRIKADIPDTM